MMSTPGQAETGAGGLAWTSAGGGLAAMVAGGGAVGAAMHTPLLQGACTEPSGVLYVGHSLKHLPQLSDDVMMSTPGQAETGAGGLVWTAAGGGWAWTFGGGAAATDWTWVAVPGSPA